jgi:DNA-binding cell septation regulator SpoVG
MSAITVLAIRRLAGDKPLKAFVDVKVGDLEINDFRVVQQANQRAWISVPQTSWKDPSSGEIRYRNLLTIPGELKQKIETAILYAWGMEASNVASKE